MRGEVALVEQITDRVDQIDGDVETAGRPEGDHVAPVKLAAQNSQLPGRERHHLGALVVPKDLVAALGQRVEDAAGAARGFHDASNRALHVGRPAGLQEVHFQAEIPTEGDVVDLGGCVQLCGTAV